MRKPGLLRATCPGGQQSFGFLLSRAFGQQIASVLGLIPMSPGWIGTAHPWRGGQHTCFGPFTQQDRFFGQQPAFPQQRDVRRSQQRFSHSSSFGRQRLQSPLRSLTQCHLGGQHLSRPHHDCCGGQRFTQTRCEAVPTRMDLHSSFGLQHSRPQPRSSRLQQRFSRGFAQTSSFPQHREPQVLTHGQLASPGLPQRVPGGQLTAPVGSPAAFFKQQQIEPATPQVSKQYFGSGPGQMQGTGKRPEQSFSQRPTVVPG
jgi:hypothetical protein